MLKRPPEHRADAPIYYIYSNDDAWDHDRIDRERRELKAKDRKARHCWDVYYSGDTRYDVDAPHTVGGTTVTPRQYLTGEPTVFRLRREGLAEARAQALSVFNDPPAWVSALWGMTMKGVMEVTDGFGGKPWDLDGGEGGRPLSQADMQLLHDIDDMLPRAIGVAVVNAAAPLSDAEKKP